MARGWGAQGEIKPVKKREGWGAQTEKDAKKSHAKQKGTTDEDSIHSGEVFDGTRKKGFLGGWK